LFRGPPDYRYYHAYFQPKREHKVLGEASPGYMYIPDAPQRMHSYNPDLKLTILLRNPISRAYSHWNMLHGRRHIEPLSFRDALEGEPERLRRTPAVMARYGYIHHGRYVEQLQRLWRYFPREQTLIFKTEDLRFRRQETLNRILDFLDVSPMTFDELTTNAGEYARPMSEDDRAYLQGVFGDEIRELEKLLGWDCSDWLK
jgi:hypothetical protein